MRIESTAFKPGGSIPPKYTCDGENINPPLAWSDVPENAKSLALIVEDPDVPLSVRADGMWDHWVVWGISPDTRGIKEGEAPSGVFRKTTSGGESYTGPCPPDREHRYFFKLFALDAEIFLALGSTKEDLFRAMEGHIIEKSELMGVYNRLK